MGSKPFGRSRASVTNDKRPRGSALNLLRWTSPGRSMETFVPAHCTLTLTWGSDEMNELFHRVARPGIPGGTAEVLRRTAERLPVDS